MKKLFMKFGLAMLMLVALLGSARADLVTVGTGTVTNTFPFYTFYHDAMSQYLYRNTEITAAGGAGGAITSIAFNISTINAALQAMGNFRIFMQNTALTTITVPIETGWTQVYQVSSFTPTSTGWVTFAFNDEFEYDEAQNLLVKICWNNSSYTGNSSVYGTTVAGTCVQRYQDNGTVDGCVTTPSGSNTTQTRPNTQFNIEMNPNIVNLYPLSGAILQTEGIYSTVPFKPGVQVKRRAGQPGTSVSYVIRGPLPQTTVLYRAHVPNVASNYWISFPTTFGDPFTHLFTAASGLGASKSPFPNNGNLDLLNNTVTGGEYEITAELKLLPPGDPAYIKTRTSKFLISLANDIAITSVSEPKMWNIKKYAFGKVPIRFEVKNVGVNPVTDFVATARIKRNGQILYEDSVRKVLAVPLTTGQAITIEEGLKDFTAPFNGKYELEVSCRLLSASDQSLGNNYVPILGGTYSFEVAYDKEPQADAIYVPESTTTYYVGRPVRPVARFSNNGITDMSNVKVYMFIKNIATGVYVYRDTTFAQDIPSGVTNNFTEVIFPKPFIAPGPGNYSACASVAYPQDPILTNNEVCINFTVSPALAGVFTIGLQNLGAPTNFPTIQSALDALFLKGIAGPMVFELTDDVYFEGNIGNSTDPALDFRTRIVGVDATNTITFRPSNQRSILREGIRINLASGAGIGMMFGQSQAPSNTASTIYAVQEKMHKDYANSEGYITFDGGHQKTFLFTIATNIPFRTVFYMSNAKNITIKNSIIKDGLNQPANYACTLPNNFLNVSLNQFQFQPDWEVSTGRAFTAGVFVRTVTPFDPRYGENRNNLDTLLSNNIVITNNEISKFAYGIADEGIGALLYSGRFKRYSNHDNVFSNNSIYDVGTAGIFVGFENNTKIEKNRIYNVTGACGNDAAGILAGTSGRDGMWGFYNTGLIINGNEISNIHGGNNIYGIKVLQVRTEMSDPAGKFVYFPEVADNNKTTNNIIWALTSTNATANKYGIRYYTERNGSFDVPVSLKQFTQNDKIINNTVIIDNDAFNNTGIIAGVALQQTKAVFMRNNAVAFLDNSIGTNDFASALLYHGYMPEVAETSINRNAYYVSNPNVPLVRFIETSDSSTVVDYGNKTNFENLSQWQYWTGMDAHSVVGDFTNDMVYVGNNPQSLRIKNTPATPKGSLLNNRGDRLPEVTNDIDGRIRGVANQRFDIGAVEFEGRFYNSDLELMKIITPGNYKESVGTFSDAEYVMTEAPVNVTARIRNSGNIQQTDVNVNLKIYRERSTEYGDPNFVGELVKSKTVKATISSTDDVALDYLLANEGGQNDDWTPQTYSDLRGTGYTVPPSFVSMQPNVTPRYRIVLSLDQNADEVLTNNMVSKVVRFYLKRASLSMIISAENGHIKIDTTINNVKSPLVSMTNLDQIAGRLNADSLVAGFRRLGWVADYTLEHPRYDFDMFERNGWEPKNVNYDMYRSMVWSDASDHAVTRLQALDIISFFKSANYPEKKNMIMASQEFVRLNQTQYPDLVKNYIRSTYSDRSGTNLPLDPTISVDQKLMGLYIARNLSTNVIPTGWANLNAVPAVVDPNPMTVMHDLFQTSAGITRVGMYYSMPVGTAATSKVISVATSTLANNVILFGLDWRHFGDIDFALRASIDYVEGNGGAIIPVELLSFDAIPVGNRVELNWTTASEINTARFDVERAEVMPIGIGSFTKVDERQAHGNTNVAIEYGPVIDRSVQAGSTYAYRLKMIDLTGEFTYSNEKIVSLDGNGAISLSEVKPNPVRLNARFDLVLANEENVNITLYDMNGKSIDVIFSGIKNAGTEELSIDTRNLSVGTYTLVLRSNNTSITRSFTVVR